MKSILTLLVITFVGGSCKYINDNASKLSQESSDSTRIRDSIASQQNLTPLASTGDETVINVEPTLIRPQLFLMMKDVAQDEREAIEKQATMYNNLDFILKKYSLQPVGSPALWRYQKQNIYFIEAGIPLDRKLPHLEPGTYYKQTTRCKAVVAHFFGKRSLLPRAFDSLTTWLKENHQRPIGEPWEVFTSDAKVMKQKDFLETDVYVEAK